MLGENYAISDVALTLKSNQHAARLAGELQWFCTTPIFFVKSVTLKL